MRNNYLHNEIIILDSNFNSVLDDNLLEEIKKVKGVIFPAKFNKPVDNLPDGLEYICFENPDRSDFSVFNHKIDNLPKTLKRLDLSYGFNQTVDNLPEGLEVLLFGCAFNKPVDNLPKSIKNIHFSWEFNNPVDFLPYGIEKLTFEHEFTHHMYNIPYSIKNIKVDINYPYIEELISIYGKIVNYDYNPLVIFFSKYRMRYILQDF